MQARCGPYWRRGASLNAADRDGRTAVHSSARIGAADTMQALLEVGGDPNRRDKDGNTPLHLASAAPPLSDFVATIHLLLWADADPGIANAEGRTPLHIVVTQHEHPGGRRGAACPWRGRQSRGSLGKHAALGSNPGWPGNPGAGNPWRCRTAAWQGCRSADRERRRADGAAAVRPRGDRVGQYPRHC